MSLLWGVYPTKIEFDADDYEEANKKAIGYVKANYKSKRCLFVSYHKVNGVEYPAITVKDL